MDIQHIVDLNHTSIKNFGGMFLEENNLREDGYGKLAYALEYAVQVSCNPVEQAAFIAEKIICNHPFNDGNKRTGFFTCAVYCKMHGIELDVDPNTVRDAVMHLIDHSWNYLDFAEYLIGKLE